MAKTLPVGIQVYTVRDYAEKDFEGTMKTLKEIGYDYVELAGLYGHSADEIAAMCKNAGVNPISAHVPIAELLADTEKTVSDYEKIGCKFIAIPYLGEDMRPGVPNYDEVLEKISAIGEVCKAHGIKLLYHNHDFEFVKMPDGSYGLDYLYAHVCSCRLSTELDTCWVKVAGEDPAAYIRKYSGRSPVVHLKDFVGGKTENMYELIGTDEAKAEKSEAFQFRPVGSGVQDFPGILAAAIEAGSEYVVVEQDSWNDLDAMECARSSREYLRKLGW